MEQGETESVPEVSLLALNLYVQGMLRVKWGVFSEVFCLESLNGCLMSIPLK